MLHFSASHVRYDPYPLLVLRPALQPDLYNELVDTYPDTSLFGTHPKYDYKLNSFREVPARQLQQVHRGVQTLEALSRVAEE